jgi:hypothetical protein
VYVSQQPADSPGDSVRRGASEGNNFPFLGDTARFFETRGLIQEYKCNIINYVKV